MSLAVEENLPRTCQSHHDIPARAGIHLWPAAAIMEPDWTPALASTTAPTKRSR